MDLCQILNNDLAATVGKYPKRFVGLGTLPMQAPELAVQEIRRCVKVGVFNIYLLQISGLYMLSTTDSQTTTIIFVALYNDCKLQSFFKGCHFVQYLHLIIL